MADTQRGGLAERDSEQAITALKKGAYLLKYGRRGKPKFCPFRLSSDESILIWYCGKEEKHLKLSHVSRIIPGQRTAIFQRYPRPEKEYQSFSLIYNDRSLDLICKDKDEAEVWFVGLKALITQGKYHKWRSESRSGSSPLNSPHSRTRRSSPTIAPFDPGDTEGVPLETRLGRAFGNIISYTAAERSSSQEESIKLSTVDKSSGQSLAEAVRVSSSSAISSSSHGSGQDDFDDAGDVFLWGEGIGDGILGGGLDRVGNSYGSEMDALLPKALISKVVLDVHSVACGGRHAVLVTKQGEIFSWGEESGGRLGHGVEADISHPKLIDALSGLNIELVACGEFHTCAVTVSGDLYTWGDGIHNIGLLGHGSEVSHWVPKKVGGVMEGIHVSYLSCGPWHTALVSSSGQLFTFGDGSFGALGHGDNKSTAIPRMVETLKGHRTVKVACGVWHTAAVVEVKNETSDSVCSDSLSGKLFTWGDGDKGQLGHGDEEPRLVPERVAALVSENICQVACGYNLTVALTISGQVYTMGSTTYGQLGSPLADGKVPRQIEGKFADSFIVEIACGSYHVAVLTSKTEVYTWGKGSNGQLGHGDYNHRSTPTLVKFLKDKQVKSVVCGSNFTAVICHHKWVSIADHSVCSDCHNPFGFRRKRHNCYNCGLVFCKACSSRKSFRASLAPTTNKPYRVCDDCYTRLKKKAMDSRSVPRIPKIKNGNIQQRSSDLADRESRGPKRLTTFSRLSSFGSVSQVGSRPSKTCMKMELHDSRVFTALNENFQFGSFYSSKASDSLGGTSQKVSSGSRMASQSTSTSEISSPARFSEEIPDYTKNKNGMLSQEIVELRAQVEDLSRKSQNLEAELGRTSKQLKEVTAIALDEAEKCKSAKEVIKSLTAQLKEMAGRLPEERRSDVGSVAGLNDNILTHLSDEGYAENRTMTGTESTRDSTNQVLLNGTMPAMGQGEWVVHDQPGVYITLSSSQGGGIELKRVRFSRRHFTEEQAAKWWAENGAELCRRLNAHCSERDR